MSPSIRCHYEVLDVAQNADEKTIKKAHRKLALKYHPDKTGGCEEAATEFRLVQQAYECLSDPAERKWYDEHRESILRGGKGFGNTGDGDDDCNRSSYIFDVTPYHFSGCFNGYGDGDNGFFQVYKEVFENILQGEKDGWISEGNIDEAEMPNAHLPSDFGCGSTDWKTVSHFYNSWESFSSCLSFAFADKYDPRDADSRWVRRRIDEENKKARKSAKRERNEEVIHFVLFVKKRDPRVKAALQRAAEEKEKKEMQRKEESRRKKEDAAAAREAWKLQREQELKEAETADLDAGRIRLADLSDSDDDYYGSGRKKGKKGKKGKKNKRRSKEIESSEEEEEIQHIDNTEDEEKDEQCNTSDAKEQSEAEGSDGEDDGHIIINDAEEESSLIDEMFNDMLSDEESSSSEEEPEPEIYKCEICRKTFKSKAQYENHIKSKKHKEAVKKWEKKNGKIKINK